jgi:hypothetical protein
VVKENVHMVIGEELEIPGKFYFNLSVHLTENSQTVNVKFFLFTSVLDAGKW